MSEIPTFHPSVNPDDEVVHAEVVVQNTAGDWVTPEEAEHEANQQRLVGELACFTEVAECASWTNLTPYLAWELMCGDKDLKEEYGGRQYYGFQLEEVAALEALATYVASCKEISDILGEWIDEDDNFVPLDEWREIYERYKAQETLN